MSKKSELRATVKLIKSHLKNLGKSNLNTRRSLWIFRFN